MTSEAVDAQLAEILSEVRQSALLSAPEGIDSEACTLRTEFANDDIILSQIDDLARQWSVSNGPTPATIRYARRDGNCFYRCSSFKLFCLMRDSPSFAEQCRQKMEIWKPIMLAHFGEYSQDFYDVVYEQVQPLCKEGHTVTEEALLKFLMGDEGPYVIVFFRYLVSLYLRSEAEFYLPFIMAQDYATVDAYCESEVEPVDHVSDDTQLVAFANLFDVQLEVYALDRTADAHITRHLFHDESPADKRISLLFRPGHYDLLI